MSCRVSVYFSRMCACVGAIPVMYCSELRYLRVGKKSNSNVQYRYCPEVGANLRPTDGSRAQCTACNGNSENVFVFRGGNRGRKLSVKNQIVYECTVLGKVSAKCLVQIIWNQVYTRKQLKRGRIGSEWGVGKMCFFFPDDSCRWRLFCIDVFMLRLPCVAFFFPTCL